MPSNRPISHKKSFSIVASATIAALLLASCNLPSPAVSTPIPPSPTVETPQATATSPEPSATFTVTASPTPNAVNIIFTTGTTAAVEMGTVQPGEVKAYTLQAGQNQPMILLLESPHGDVYLGVNNPDGSVLLDPAKKWNQWQWLLPKTGMYTIQVFGGATTRNYTLTAKVAQRVNFASGATSITLNGKTVNGFVFSYALGCKAGQTMTATLNVPASTAYLDIFGLATGTLLSASAQVNTWTGALPATEDYIIEVIPKNGQVVNYSLTVSVP